LGKLKSIESKVNTANLSVGSSVAVDRITGRRLIWIRERIAIRDEYTCQICGRLTVDGEVDHKTPLHLGGSACSDLNLQWLCKCCHKEKSKKEGERREWPEKK